MDSPPLPPPDPLTLSTAVAFAARAARAWTHRNHPEARTSGADLVKALMVASAWVTRARADQSLGLLEVAELVDNFSRPVSDWLPGADSGLVLVEHGEASPACEELADEGGTSPAAEQEQRVMVRVMQNLGSAPDAPARYTRFRRFLIEYPTALHAEAAAVARSVRIPLAELYEEISPGARFLVGGHEVTYPCPRCHWPMRVTERDLRCAFSEGCLAAGARYLRRGEELVPLGGLGLPQPRSCDGLAALRRGVWRFTVLPGLEEIALEQRLLGIPEVRVELWPYVDAWDLDVHRQARHWRVDVKDHASALRLARQLAERPASEETWIVVPDRRKEQVAQLKRLVPEDAGYRFASVSGLVRLVQGAT